MKIELDIEDDGRSFKAYKGRELVAFVEGDTLFIKETSCNLCGECCMTNPGTVYGDDEEGKCKKLVKFGDTWECSAGVDAPWRCLDDPRDIDCCSITYRKIKVK